MGPDPFFHEPREIWNDLEKKGIWPHFLVPVMLGLVWALNRDTEIVGLPRRELFQTYAKLIQM